MRTREMRRRIVLLAIVGLTPTLCSAQVPLDADRVEWGAIQAVPATSMVAPGAGVERRGGEVLELGVGGPPCDPFPESVASPDQHRGAADPLQTTIGTASNPMFAGVIGPGILKMGPDRIGQGQALGTDPDSYRPLSIARAYGRIGHENAGQSRAAGGPRRSAIGWGIAIGIGAAVVGTGLAASSYGENEGGRFCTRCFLQWSAIALPVGAGAGAAIGFLIDRVRR